MTPSTVSISDVDRTWGCVDAPATLRADEVWYDHMHISLPKYTDEAGVVPELYRLRIVSHTANTVQGHVTRAEVKQSRGRVRVSGLQPSTWYTVEVRLPRAISPSETLEVRTADPPVISQSMVHPNSLTVQWTLPRSEATSGHDRVSVPLASIRCDAVLEIYICLKTALVLNVPVRTWRGVVPAGQETGSVDIDDLDPHTAYFISTRLGLVNDTKSVEMTENDLVEAEAQRAIREAFIQQAEEEEEEEEEQREEEAEEITPVGSRPWWEGPVPIVSGTAVSGVQTLEQFGPWCSPVRMLTLPYVSVRVAAIGTDFIKIEWKRLASSGRLHGVEDDEDGERRKNDVAFYSNQDALVANTKIQIWEDPTWSIKQNAVLREKSRTPKQPELFREERLVAEVVPHSANSAVVLNLPTDSVFFMCITHLNTVGAWSAPKRVRFATLRNVELLNLNLSQSSITVTGAPCVRQRVPFCNIHATFPERTVFTEDSQGNSMERPEGLRLPQHRYTGKDVRTLADTERWEPAMVGNVPERYALKCVDVDSGKVLIKSYRTEEIGRDADMLLKMQATDLKAGVAHLLSTRMLLDDTWSDWSPALLVTTIHPLKLRVVTRSASQLTVRWGRTPVSAALPIPWHPVARPRVYDEIDASQIFDDNDDKTHHPRETQGIVRYQSRLTDPDEGVYYYDEWAGIEDLVQFGDDNDLAMEEEAECAERALRGVLAASAASSTVMGVQFNNTLNETQEAAVRDAKERLATRRTDYRNMTKISSFVKHSTRQLSDTESDAYEDVWDGHSLSRTGNTKRMRKKLDTRIRRVGKTVHPPKQKCQKAEFIALTLWREGGILPEDDDNDEVHELFPEEADSSRTDQEESEYQKILRTWTAGTPDCGACEDPFSVLSSAERCKQTVVLRSTQECHVFVNLNENTLYSCRLAVRSHTGVWRTCHTACGTTLMDGVQVGSLFPLTRQNLMLGWAPSSPSALTTCNPHQLKKHLKECSKLKDSERTGLQQCADEEDDAAPSLYVEDVTEAYAGLSWHIPVGILSILDAAPLSAVEVRRLKRQTKGEDVQGDAWLRDERNYYTGLRKERSEMDRGGREPISECLASSRSLHIHPDPSTPHDPQHEALHSVRDFEGSVSSATSTVSSASSSPSSEEGEIEIAQPVTSEIYKSAINWKLVAEVPDEVLARQKALRKRERFETKVRLRKQVKKRGDTSRGRQNGTTFCDTFEATTLPPQEEKESDSLEEGFLLDPTSSTLIRTQGRKKNLRMKRNHTTHTTEPTEDTNGLWKLGEVAADRFHDVLLREYKVVLTPVCADNTVAPREIYFRAAMNRVHVTGLRSETQYHATLHIYDTGADEWKFVSNTVSFSSLSATKVKVGDVHKDLISFTWDREKSWVGKDDGIATHSQIAQDEANHVGVRCYKMVVTAEPNPDDTTHISETIEKQVVARNICSHHLYALSPSTVYSANVCPLYEGGLWGKPSNSIRFFYSYIIPKVVTITSDQLHLAWVLPDKALLHAESNPPLFAGKVIMQISGPSIDICTELEAPTTNHHVSNLTSDTEYTVTIVICHQVTQEISSSSLPGPGEGYERFKPASLKVKTSSVPIPLLGSLGEDFTVVHIPVIFVPIVKEAGSKMVRSKNGLSREVVLGKLYSSTAEEEEDSAFADLPPNKQKTRPASASTLSSVGSSSCCSGLRKEASNVASPLTPFDGETKRLSIIEERVPALGREISTGGKQIASIVVQTRISQAHTRTTRVDTIRVPLIDSDAAENTLETVMVHIASLRPNTAYLIEYRHELACTTMGSWSQELHINTLPPLIPSVESVGEQFALLTWKREPGLEEYIKHMPQSFQVIIEETSLQPTNKNDGRSSQIATFQKCIQTSQSAAVLSGLKPRTPYKARARQRTSDREDEWGVWSDEVHLATLPEMVAKVLSKGQDYLEIAWEREPKNFRQTHPILAICHSPEWQCRVSPLVAGTVRITDYNTGKLLEEADVECSEGNPQSRSLCTSSSLTPNTVYCVSVMMKYRPACEGDATEYYQGEWSRAVHIPTLPVIKLEVTETRETCFVLSWGRPMTDPTELETALKRIEARKMLESEDFLPKPRLLQSSADTLGTPHYDHGAMDALSLVPFNDLDAYLPEPDPDAVPRLDYEGLIPPVGWWYIEVEAVSGGQHCFNEGGCPAEGLSDSSIAWHLHSERGTQILKATIPGNGTTFCEGVAVLRLLPDRVYSVRAKIVDESGRDGTWSSRTYATTLAIPRVSVTAVSETTASLAWVRAAPSCQSAVTEHGKATPEIYAKTGKDVFCQVVVVSRGDLGKGTPRCLVDEVLDADHGLFRVTGLIPGARYSVLVRFRNSKDNGVTSCYGPWSAIARFATLTGVWESLKVIDIGQDYCRVGWKPPSLATMLEQEIWDELLPEEREVGAAGCECTVFARVMPAGVFRGSSLQFALQDAKVEAPIAVEVEGVAIRAVPAPKPLDNSCTAVVVKSDEPTAATPCTDKPSAALPFLQHLYNPGKAPQGAPEAHTLKGSRDFDDPAVVRWEFTIGGLVPHTVYQLGLKSEYTEKSCEGMWGGARGKVHLQFVTMQMFEFQVISIGETWGHFGVRVPPQTAERGVLTPARSNPCTFEILLNDMQMPQWLKMADPPTGYSDLKLRKLGRDTMYSVRLRETRFGRSWGEWQQMATFSTQPHPPQVGELMECRDGWISFNWGVFDPKKGAGVKLTGDQVPREYMFSVEMRRVVPRNDNDTKTVQEILSLPEDKTTKFAITESNHTSADPPHRGLRWSGGWEEVGITEKPFIRMPLQGNIAEYYYRVRLSKHFVGQKGKLIPTWGEYGMLFHWAAPSPPKPAQCLRVAELSSTSAVIEWDLPKNYASQPRLLFDVFLDASPRDARSRWTLLHTTDTTAFSFQNLAASQNYRVAVRAESAFGRATKSNVLSFTTHVIGAAPGKERGGERDGKGVPQSPALMSPVGGYRPNTAPSPMVQLGRPLGALSPMSSTAEVASPVFSPGSTLPKVARRESPQGMSEQRRRAEARAASELKKRGRVVHGIPGVLPPARPNNLYDKYRVEKSRKQTVLANLGTKKYQMSERGKSIMQVVRKGMAFMADMNAAEASPKKTPFQRMFAGAGLSKPRSPRGKGATFAGLVKLQREKCKLEKPVLAPFRAGGSSQARGGGLAPGGPTRGMSSNCLLSSPRSVAGSFRRQHAQTQKVTTLEELTVSDPDPCLVGDDATAALQEKEKEKSNGEEERDSEAEVEVDKVDKDVSGQEVEGNEAEEDEMPISVPTVTDTDCV